jgi:hypothetical protein
VNVQLDKAATRAVELGLTNHDAPARKRRAAIGDPL